MSQISWKQWLHQSRQAGWRKWATGLVGGTLTAATLGLLVPAAQAQIAETRFPSLPTLDLQTSGRERPPENGDWYTTLTSASTDRVHRFFINIASSDLAAAGGSLTIRVEEAESNGAFDSINGTLPFGAITCTAPGVAGGGCDPTQFQLIGPTGAVLATITVPSNSADGTTITFPPITTPGVYQVTSVVGAFPVAGDATVDLNNDDNNFDIVVVGAANLDVGILRGTFEGTPGPTLNFDLYFLVGPGVSNLFLRNFDMDNAGNLSYVSPPGGAGTFGGTISGNGVWNGPGASGTLNTGGDTVGPLNPILDSGFWTWQVRNLNPENQVAFEAYAGNTPLTPGLPILDRPPTRAGNFTLVHNPNATIPATCASVTVNNLFFTSDIINLAATGTDPAITLEFRDATGTTPLTDTDGDGLVDTGILQAGQSLTVTLCASATGTINNTVTIQGTSFLDRVVRQQAGTGAPTVFSLQKVFTGTGPPGTPGTPGTPGASTQRVQIVKRITNVLRAGVPLGTVNFGTFINDPTSNNDDSPGWAQFPPLGVIDIPQTAGVQSGDVLEYTVYFLVEGDRPALNFSICDNLSSLVSPIEDSGVIQRAGRSPGPGGLILSPLVPLPPGNPCSDQTNANGTALFDLGDVSNTPGNNFGFVRFRVRVN